MELLKWRVQVIIMNNYNSKSGTSQQFIFTQMFLFEIQSLWQLNFKSFKASYKTFLKNLYKKFEIKLAKYHFINMCTFIIGPTNVKICTPFQRYNVIT